MLNAWTCQHFIILVWASVNRQIINLIIIQLLMFVCGIVTNNSRVQYRDLSIIKHYVILGGGYVSFFVVVFEGSVKCV